MTCAHPLVALLVRSPGPGQAGRSDGDQQDGHPGQHGHHAEEVCRGLAKSDDRVRYHRQPTNIGLLNNFTFVMGSDATTAPNIPPATK